MKSKLILAATAICTALAFAGCDKELNPAEPGMLVPKTVDQDPAQPSIMVNGTQLHAETFGEAGNPIVIFLHGGPGSDYRNALQVKQLANDGYFVVFYDQRGSGLSKRHQKSTYSIQLMLDDLAAVIAHYRTSPAQKVFLFGHSWGAILATAYINKYPGQINGVVLAEAGGFTWAEVKRYVQDTKQLKLFDEITSDAIYQDQVITGKESQQQVLDYKRALQSSFVYAAGNIEGIEGPSPYWRYGTIVQVALFDIAKKEGFDFTGNLHQFAPKVVLLYSQNNKAYGDATAQRQAAYFNHAQITRIDGTGHEMIWFKWASVYPVVLTYLNALK